MDIEKEEQELENVCDDHKNDLPECDQALQIMFKRIANSPDAFFKSQQRNEPDLVEQEKIKICSDVLTENVPVFLSRYGKYLTADDLPYFKEMNEDYAIKFHLDEIEKQLIDGNQKKIIKNRRFQALKKLASDQNYLSDFEMKKRNPLLYEQMVGRFLTDEEKSDIEKRNKTECKLSSIIIEHAIKQETSKLYEKQSEIEDSMMEEEEEDDSDHDEEMMGTDDEISHEQKELLRQEFISLMEQNFIDGNDDFDYSNVDFNEEYDSIITTQQDAEDRYFDSEEPT